MAAGLGFKDFVTGEVLTAADVDGYLMQGVWVFASAAARDAAVTSPQEGNFAYLKDTNVTTYYTGSAWANLDTTGMTNPMTTTGDTIYSSSGSTPARLGIGSTGNVLTVAGGVPTWAAPAAGGGMTSIASGSLSSNSTVISSITGGYVNLMLFVKDYYAGAGDYLQIRFNGDTSTTHMWTTTNTRLTSAINNPGANAFDSNDGAEGGTGADTNNFLQMTIFDYTNTNTMKSGDWNWVYTSETGGVRCCSGGIAWKNATPAAITSITLKTAAASNWGGGTYELYGVK
jgi:hypothetical protein